MGLSRSALEVLHRNELFLIRNAWGCLPKAIIWGLGVSYLKYLNLFSIFYPPLNEQARFMIPILVDEVSDHQGEINSLDVLRAAND